MLGAGSTKQQRIIKLKDSRTCLVLTISDIFKRLQFSRRLLSIAFLSSCAVSITYYARTGGDGHGIEH